MQMPNRLLCAVRDHLASGGVDPIPLARAAGLAPLHFAPDAQVPLERQAVFFERASERLGDPHLGLTLARARAEGTFGLFEFLLRSCSTFGELLERACRYYALINPMAAVRYEVQGDALEFLHDVPGAAAVLGRHGNELALGIMYQLVQDLLGRPAPVRTVWFANPPPGDPAPLQAFFGGSPVTFGRESNGFALPATLLDERLGKADPVLSSFLESEARERARTIPGRDDLVAQVTQAIRDELADGAPGVERIARRLGQSTRTLQRRLEREGVSHAELLERTRRELAHRLIADPDRSVTEIAFLTGYSDLSAFLRAFKRWTGQNPGELRRRS